MARVVALIAAAVSASASAAAPPAPQSLPAGWAQGSAAASMLLRQPAAAGALDPRLRPNIGNGFLATLAGSGNVYLAGVYNLAGTFEPFRARLPGVAAMTLHGDNSSQPRTACARGWLQ